tara:strand:+ start:66 stop:425 length:360 start_codon:yes stop_codon:yes gene_type:complete
MAEAEKSRTALVLELERVELEAQAEVHGLGPASEGGSAVAKAALERQRAAAQALRRKLKMKDAQLAQYVDLAHSFVCLYNGPRLLARRELTPVESLPSTPSRELHRINRTIAGYASSVA